MHNPRSPSTTPSIVHRFFLKWRGLLFPLRVVNDLPRAIRSFTQTGCKELLHRLEVTESFSAAIPATAMSMAVPNRATELISQGSSTSAETSGCWLCGVCPSTLPLCSICFPFGDPALTYSLDVQRSYEVRSMTIF